MLLGHKLPNLAKHDNPAVRRRVTVNPFPLPCGNRTVADEPTAGSLCIGPPSLASSAGPFSVGLREANDDGDDMPKFRTTEPPEQSSSGLIGLLIVVAMLAIIVALFVKADPLQGHALQAKVFVPPSTDN